jgi:hypothetical protein
MQLDIADVTKVYPGGVTAVSEVTMRIGPGVLGLLGVGVENSDPQGLRVAQHGSFILPTHRLRAETHRCPPRRCGARTNTTP